MGETESPNGDSDHKPAARRPFEFDPEIDLLNRYDTMVQTQVETLNQIDDKAAFVGRYVGILAGLIVSITSFVFTSQNIDIQDVSIEFSLTLVFSVLFLFLSLAFAMVTYLSSKFEYGPGHRVGFDMATARIDDQDYKDLLLRGYSDALIKNRNVVVNNASRLKHSLNFLLIGLVTLFASGVIIVIEGSLAKSAVAIIGAVVDAFVFFL